MSGTVCSGACHGLLTTPKSSATSGKTLNYWGQIMSKPYYEVILVALVIATVAVWSFNFGTLSVAVGPATTLQDAYLDYSYIKIYEDGSYEGENRQGQRVTGCIPDALCAKGGMK